MTCASSVVTDSSVAGYERSAGSVSAKGRVVLEKDLRMAFSQASLKKVVSRMKSGSMASRQRPTRLQGRADRLS